MMISSTTHIIGGGAIGMLVARELLAEGCSVVLYDRAGLGQESSWAGGGILSPLYPWRYPEPVTLLAKWSQHAYPGLAQELMTTTGIDPEWIQSGLLAIDIDDGDLAESWARSYGTQLSKLTPRELAGLEPNAAPGNVNVYHLPEIAQIRNPRLVQALKSELVKKGCEIRENVEIMGLKTGNGKITGIIASDQFIPTDVVIIAAGAWSGNLLAPLGIELPVKPIRGQMMLYHAQPGWLGHILLRSDHYAIPRSDGHILVGSTLEDVGFSKETTQIARQSLTKAAQEMLPGIEDFKVVAQWAGLRPGNDRQGIPYIGAHPEMANLWVCTGHFRNGLVLGPASARLMADLVLDRNPAVEPGPYQFDSLVIQGF